MNDSITVGEIIKRMNSGEPVPEIAAELDVSKDTLNRRLKGIGYEWDNQAKERIFIGEGEPPVNMSSHDLLNKKTPNSPKGENKKKKSSHKDEIDSTQDSHKDEQEVKVNSQRDETKVNDNSHKGEKKVNTISDKYLKLMYEELKALRSDMKQNKDAHEEIQAIKEIAATSVQEKEDLFTRISEMDQGEKVRKTIVINKATGELFDAFTKEKKVNKSDILALALMDFMEKYE